MWWMIAATLASWALTLFSPLPPSTDSMGMGQGFAFMWRVIILVIVTLVAWLIYFALT